MVVVVQEPAEAREEGLVVAQQVGVLAAVEAAALFFEAKLVVVIVKPVVELEVGAVEPGAVLWFVLQFLRVQKMLYLKRNVLL